MSDSGAYVSIQSLAILGPGTLGLSTAQWAAECALQVRLLGRDLEHAAKGLAEIERRWKVAVQRGQLTAQKHGEASHRLTAHAPSPESLESMDVLLEALPESLEIKGHAWRQQKKWVPSKTLLLSGTSSLSIAAINAVAGLENRILGFHLFVPVSRMAIVELIHPLQTHQEWIERAKALAVVLQKRVVSVKDQPGFAASRMALALSLEAMRLVEAEVTSPEEIDALMVLGYGHPVGPLELSDRVGLDLRYAIATELERSTGDPRFAPPDIFRHKVMRGEWGRKKGQGFYAWDSQGRRR